MPTETTRKMSVRRITAPDDDTVYVDLKVIDAIAFIDPREQYQEWQFSFENNPNAKRKVHVKEIGEDKLKVERIDVLSTMHNGLVRGQERQKFFNNQDDSDPHYKTHKKKIYQRNKDGTKNEDVWIEVERIDKIFFKDPRDNYQEKLWTLQWPDLDDDEWDYKDLSDPRTEWDGTDINPPWRIDPFQNITDCSLSSGNMLIYYKRGSAYWLAAIPMGKINNPTAKDVTVNKASTFNVDMWAFAYSSVQMKIASDTHVVATHVKFGTDGTASIPDASKHNLYYYNTKNSLLKATKAPADVQAAWFTPINWASKTVYDIAGNKVEFKPKNEVVATLNSSWVFFSTAAAVSATGGIYSAPRVSPGGISIQGDGYISQDQADQSSAKTGYFVQAFYGGPGESDLNHNGATYYSSTVNAGSAATKYYFNTYSNDGKLDKVGLSSTTASANSTYSSQDPPVPGTNSLNSSISIFGLSGSYSFTDDGSGATKSGNVDIVFNAGYSFGATLSGSWLSYTLGDSETRRSQTPFGVKPGDTAVTSFFAANGKTSITSISYYNGADFTFEIYKDRTEYGSKLQSAIGASAKDIQLILLDIKGSDIAKLK